MAKTEPVSAAEFARNFEHYRLLAQKAAIPVASRGQIDGYFVPAEEYEAFERYRRRRRSFAAGELDEETLRAIAETEMDPRHAHLDDLLK